MLCGLQLASNTRQCSKCSSTSGLTFLFLNLKLSCIFHYSEWAYPQCVLRVRQGVGKAADFQVLLGDHVVPARGSRHRQVALHELSLHTFEVMACADKDVL